MLRALNLLVCLGGTGVSGADVCDTSLTLLSAPSLLLELLANGFLVLRTKQTKLYSKVHGAKTTALQNNIDIQ